MRVPCIRIIGTPSGCSAGSIRTLLMAIPTLSTVFTLKSRRTTAMNDTPLVLAPAYRGMSLPAQSSATISGGETGHRSQPPLSVRPLPEEHDRDLHRPDHLRSRAADDEAADARVTIGAH